MSTNYPGALDNTTVLKNDAVNATLTETTHPAHHNNLSDAVIAIETELGINPSGAGYATVALAIAALDAGTGSFVHKTPTADQIVLPSADKINLALRAFNSGQTSKVLEIRNAAGTVVGYFDKLGGLSAASLAVGGTALAASHLSNGVLGTGAIVLGTSATLTTPTLTNPTVTTGTFSSPALTGTPTAPTATLGDDSTKIATTAFVQDAVGGSSVPAGTILEYAGAAAPTGFLLCDGSAYNRITYSTLFGVISTAYGSGDGINTFNVPDKRGRMGVGKGTHTDVDTLGKSEGESTVGNRRPAHKHTTTHSTDGSHTHTGSTASSGAHTHTYIAASGSGTSAHSGPDVTTITGASANTGSSGAHTHTMSLDAAGSHTHTITVGPQTAVPLDAPGYLVCNYIIKT